jgi:hypothetical protein
MVVDKLNVALFKSPFFKQLSYETMVVDKLNVALFKSPFFKQLSYETMVVDKLEAQHGKLKPNLGIILLRQF